MRQAAFFMPPFKPVPAPPIRGATATAPAPPVPSETQTRILGAALELFADRGFSATTTADIARLAGVAEKTIFAHFKTKEALFDRTLTPATIDLLIPEVKAPAKPIPREPRTLEDFLSALVRDRVELFSRHPAKFKLIVQELILRPERARRFVADIDQTFHGGVEQAFRRLQKDGELRELSMAQLHRIILSAIIGYAVSRLVLWPDRPWDDDAELRATVDVLVNGLRPPPVRRSRKP
jgi:AcrR family transcriptional regulator